MTWFEQQMHQSHERTKFYSEMRLYNATVMAWYGKKSTTNIVYENVETSSYYYNEDKASLRVDAEDEVLYHEIGHAVYRKFDGCEIIDISEFIDEANSCTELMMLDTWENIQTLLDLYAEKYNHYYRKSDRRHPINIISDFYGMMFHCNFGYVQHKIDYNKDGDENLLKNETFAEMFSTIATSNYDRYHFMRLYYPKFSISCLNLIERIKK